MDNQQLQSFLAQEFPDQQVVVGNQFVEMTVDQDKLHDTAEKLKNHDSLRFDFLVCQTGVDLNGKLGEVCHLRSTQLAHSCVIKVFANDRENAALDTLSDVWQSAHYFEREIFDLVGIRFNNHPNMKRIFLEDDFVGHPLRKDFEDTINIIQK